MKKSLITFTILLLIVSFGMWLNFENIRAWYQVPDRVPFDGSTIPGRAMEAVCVFGWPVMVSMVNSDLETYFVIFPGPIEEYRGENSKIYNYAGYYVSTPPNEFGDAINNLNSLKEYEATALPDKLVEYQLRKINGLPEDLDEVVEIIGPWDLEITRSNPERLRLVWNQQLCIGDKLIHGVWVETIDNKIVKTKALTNQNSVNKYFAP